MSIKFESNSSDHDEAHLFNSYQHTVSGQLEGSIFNHTPLNEFINSKNRDSCSSFTRFSIKPNRSVLEDAQRLRYGSVKEIWKDFCGKTSSHGVPWIEASRSHIGTCFWSFLTILTGIASVLNGYFLIDKFAQYDKVAQMHIMFGSVPFPAVTICNLNPYKNSIVPDEMKQYFAAYGHVRDKTIEEKSRTKTKNERFLYYNRRRRSSSKLNETVTVHRMWETNADFKYAPVITLCSCSDYRDDCVPIPREVSGSSRCYCYEEIHTQAMWPCYHESQWHKYTCPECSVTGRCSMPSAVSEPHPFTDQPPVPCLCQLVTKSCVVQPLKIRSKIYTETTPPPPSTPSPEFLEKRNLKDIKGEGELQTKGKEEVIYQTSNMDPETKQNMSYSKEELFQMCSFDGEDCSIDDDFELEIDPNFGNCYKYNYDLRFNRTSTRAGPLYGLRVLVYVDVDDYIPVTQATGIRLTIHAKKTHPFPDVFGYSAPTGTISSFGLKLKEIIRLTKPYGDCLNTDKPTIQYIYNSSYTVEGCYRGCYQRAMLEQCGCIDIRYPEPSPGLDVCTDAQERSCLDKHSKGLMKIKDADNCTCKQPCSESVYTVSYSAATWPAFTHSIRHCSTNDRKCIEQYRENAVMLEVYYEQISYESVKEKEAYAVVNLLADMGGQIGLWLGLSVITVFEWFVLIGNLFMFGCYSRKRSKDRKKSSESRIIGTANADHLNANYVHSTPNLAANSTETQRML